MPNGLYYPSLSTIIDLNALPESFDFIHNNSGTFLDKIFYRNLQIVKTASGDCTFISIELVLKKRLSIDLLGGITLVLNPDYDENTNYTVIPLTFNYSWRILKYINSFDLPSFVFNPENIFDLFFNVVKISDTGLLYALLSGLINDSDPLDALVDYLNTEYSAAIGTLDPDYETALGQIITAINTNTSKTVKEIVFEDYVVDTNSLDNTFTNINKLLEPVVGPDSVSFIKDLILPDIQASIELSAGIEVSRDILQPMEEVSGEYIVVEEPAKTIFLIEAAAIKFDSRNGKIEFPDSITLNLQDPYDRAQILGLPLSFSFEDAKIQIERKVGDYSEGYQTSISIEEAVLYLPPIFETSSTAYIKGENMVIDSENGFSGELTLELGANTFLDFNILNSVVLKFTSFSVTFEESAIQPGATIGGSIEIPGVNAPIDFDVEIDEQGIHFDLDTAAGPAFEISRSLLIPLNSGNVEAASPNKTKFILDSASLDYDPGTGDIGFDIDIHYDNSTYPKARIAGTPVTVAFSGAMGLSYSETNGTEVSIASVELGILSLTKNGTGPSIKATNVIINNNGLSGTFALDGAGTLNLDLSNYGISLSLSSVSITIVNNSITAGSATGTISIPGASTTLTVTLGITNSGFTISITGTGAVFEINRSLLKPLNASNQVVAGNTKFTITGGSISYNSSNGAIGVGITLSMHSTTPKAQIQDALILSFTGLSLEITPTAKVVKIASVSVSLPPELSQTNSVQITGTNVVIDSVNGFSGTITASASLTFTLFGQNITINAFSLTFVNNSVSGGGFIAGTLARTSPTAYSINFKIYIGNGFKIEVESPAGIALLNPSNKNLQITVYSIIIGRYLDVNDNAVWELGFGTTTQSKGVVMEMKRELPVIKDLFPKYFAIKYETLFKTDGSGLKFNLEAEWYNGIKVSGNQTTGLEISLPVQLKVADVFKMDGILLVIKHNNTTATTSIEVIIKNAGLNFGPVSGSIDGFGAELTIQKDQTSNANLGPFRTDLSFVGPRGVGIELKSPVISGGGYLYIGDNEYMGALSLSFKNKISLNALGILTTKLPGGQSGYSLLVIITAEFTPIQLGMGFTLQGVGGLLGLNRTINTDKLRAGVKDKTLDNILFPQDVIKNAHSILSNIAQVFPAKKDRFLIGPMAKLGWGTPTLLTIEIGVIVELPSPVTLAILGVIKALIPGENNRIIAIQVNFLGIIDFDKKQLSFDASLYDSKILTFGLMGDMALRVYWGDQPNFLLSIGGFHPKYTPPPMNLPQMQRLTIVLADSSNLSVKVETYFAVTSNSVQFGARVSAMAKAGLFKAVGALWFDILFQFKPFYFIASMGAMFAITRKSKELFSIYIELTLEGPNPWKVEGTGEFRFLGVRITVGFKKTFGQQRVEAIEPAPVWGKLLGALQNKDNWVGVEAQAGNTVVSFRTIDNATGVILDTYGSLVFNQKLVPFNLKMDKYGNVPIADYSIFEVDTVSIGPLGSATTVGTNRLQDYFARNEFFYMNDDEKLSKPAFEKFDSGIAIGGTDQVKSDYVVHREVLFDEKIIDVDRNVVYNPNPQPIAAVAFDRHFFGCYITDSQWSSFSATTSASGPQRIKVAEDSFVLSDKNDLSEYTSAGTFTSYTEAQIYLDNNPSLAANHIISYSIEN